MRSLFPLLFLLLGACATLKRSQIDKIDTRLEHERRISAMDRLRIQHQLRGAELQLRLERHDLCHTRRFELRTPIQERSAESEGLLTQLLLSVSTLGVAGALEAQEMRGYALGTGALGSALLLHAAYIGWAEGQTQEIKGETQRVLSHEEELPCQIRALPRAWVELQDEDGRPLGRARSDLKGRLRLSLLRARPERLFRFRLEIRLASLLYQQTLELEAAERGALVQLLERRRAQRPPSKLSARLRFDDSAGDGDGRLDAAEPAWLSLEISNLGQGAAEALELRLQPPPALQSHLELERYQILEEISPGERAQIRFKLLAHEDLPGGRHTLLLSFKEQGRVEEQRLALELETVAWRGPRLGVQRLSLRDDGQEGSQGDGDGLLEINELITLELEVLNSGSAVARALELNLKSGSRFIQLLQASSRLGNLLPGEHRRALLRFRVEQGYRGPKHLPLSLELKEARPRYNLSPNLSLYLGAGLKPQGPLKRRGVARLAVLELQDSAGLAAEELAYLSDLLRGIALRLLPKRYFLMTRENLLAQLPPGQALSDCLGGCEIETARRVGADFVISGQLLRFGSELRLNLKLHDSASAALLAQAQASAEQLKALEFALGAAARRLLAPLR